MLFGLYLFTPIIIMVKERISNRVFCISSFVWLAFSIWFQSNSEYLVSYSFGVVFAYMGYFLVGNVIYESTKKKSSIKAIAYMSLSVLFLVITYLIRQTFGIDKYLWNPYSSFFSPTIAIASVLLFFAIRNVNLKLSFGKLPNLMFYVYLFHTLVYQMIFLVIKDRIIYNTIITILVISVATFVISLIISVVFVRIWKICEKNIKIHDKR
jgi:surface polysaccharide O-acyltransferase-like enzyme